jgi:hypothetical protein
VIAVEMKSALTWTVHLSARRVIRAALALTCLLTPLLLADLAHAESAWWHLSTGTRPAYLHAGAARPGNPEVQEIFTEPGTIEGFAEQTNFVLRASDPGLNEPARLEEFATEPLAAAFGVKLLSAANIQAALESPVYPAYGPGNVKVEEVTTDRQGRPLEHGDKRYLVTSGLETLQNLLTATPEPPSKATTAEVTKAKNALPDGEIYVTAENVSGQSISGQRSPVKLTDVLPQGLRAVTADATEPGFRGLLERDEGSCSIEAAGARVTCAIAKKPKEPTGFHGGSEYEPITPYSQILMRIGVMVEGAESGEQNEVSISGGEAFACRNVGVGKGFYAESGCLLGETLSPGLPAYPFERIATGSVLPTSVKRPITISSEPVPFGVESYELTQEEEGGASTTQAGAHPFQQTTTISLNQTADIGPPGNGNLVFPDFMPAALAKDVHFLWPEGLIGNPTVFPRCTDAQFFTSNPAGTTNLCPDDTAVGAATVLVNEPNFVRLVDITVPLFNLTPRPGEPARLGFNVVIAHAPVTIDTSIRTGSDYGVTVSVNNITQTAALISSEVTVWGVPGDPRHAHQRGWDCLEVSRGRESDQGPCPPSESRPAPFLSMPTDCRAPLSTGVEADSWTAPTDFVRSAGMFGPETALTGCNRLPFSPGIKVTPDGQAGSTPTGLTVDVHVPQEGQLNAAGLASSNIKDIDVALPEGVALNPAAADGLEACSESQIGYLPGLSSPPSELDFTETLPEPIEQGANFCPDASKVGTVTIKTPLLPNPLEGAVYLATPAPNEEEGQNPFKTLAAMYIVAKDPVSGALVKLPGKITLNQQTGRIASSFENTPQLAFEDAELHFFGGERAPLSTPAHCRTYTTNATFTPWSGNPPAQSQASFQITSGPGGGSCPGSSLPFAPSLQVGTTNIQAGAFSTLDTTIGREDGNQNLQAVRLQMPPGFTGLLSSVKLCPEEQADAGTCGPESLIGHTTVSVGLGGDPYTVTGGEVFITGPYEGAPFGLSIVNPAKAGPYNLGKVVVRGKIEVDPHTAALTITTDDTGPYKIPSILDGIPLQIKHVAVTIDRSSFTINPTSCNPMAVTGTLSSTEGANAALNVPFQVTNCATLAFAPKFQVSTQGKTSKADGASLTARLSYPVAPQGAQANIARVMVDLPKQLPSRLTTLQKACTNAQFEANPAGCPQASFIGHATVTTPLLPVPLSGPAIFVSHGGEAFPSLIMVLQGYGITVDLVGTTFISKAGVTSTTFKTVPDTPFYTFELTLPEGPFSALAANGNLCTSKLAMPTEFVAQNATIIHQSTPVSVTGCAKKKTLTRAQKLTAALKACHKDVRHAKRQKCEKEARAKYGPVRKKVVRKK